MTSSNGEGAGWTDCLGSVAMVVSLRDFDCRSRSLRTELWRTVHKAGNRPRGWSARSCVDRNMISVKRGLQMDAPGSARLRMRHCKRLQSSALDLSGANDRSVDSVRHPNCVRRRFAVGRSPGAGPTQRCRSRSGNIIFGVADRIACSCVTCPRCGTWVVLTQPAVVGSGQEKFRVGCAAPECGKEFEFDASETHVFDLPLPLFERRHFFRSELW